jgi:hypothetical protein
LEAPYSDAWLYILYKKGLWLENLTVVEYHLGRAAFRLCKRNSKYCAWHPGLPDLFVWR